MIEALLKLGAQEKFSDRLLGYAFVTLPKERILDALGIAGISRGYTTLNGGIDEQPNRSEAVSGALKPTKTPSFVIPFPNVSTENLEGGPYFAATDIGLSDLWRLHPNADGRGVSVAVVDDGIDLLHPALQRALSMDGTLIPKVADIAVSPLSEGSGIVVFGGLISTDNGTFEANGITWKIPKKGTYRFGVLKEELSLGPDRNSRAEKVLIVAGVLWDTQNNRIWVDTNGNYSFEDERMLGDYGLTQDIAWFGENRSSGDNRIPFGVKIDAAQGLVYVRIGGYHGTFVAGPLGGNVYTGGLFNGAAPGVQLVDQDDAGGQRLPAILKMMARPDVSVVNYSGGIGRAGYSANREGMEDFAQRVLERAIEVYRKPIATYSAGPGTIQVNDYTEPDMLRRNRQLGPPYREAINSVVWSLPNGLINTVLAPSTNLVTLSRYKPMDLIWPDGRRHALRDTIIDPPAPSGYGIGANNSPTIPVVSGILADLISEAKSEHVRYDATRLNNAIFTGTMLVEGFPLSRQGYGLVNAERSWEQLLNMSKVDDPAYSELTSFSVSRVVTGRRVEVYGFHSEMFTIAGNANQQIWITRHGGYSGTRRYMFSLRGNDGSFELIDHQANLGRDKATGIRFRIAATSGWHVAFLELRDLATGVVMQDVPLSVRLPDLPVRLAQGVDRYDSKLEPLRSEYRYVLVGKEVQATRYVMAIPYTGGAFCCSARLFPGFSYDEEDPPAGPPVDAFHHVGPVERLESLIGNERPGIKQIFWDNRGQPEYTTIYDPPAPDVPLQATLTVMKYAVAITKAPSNKLLVSNQLADVNGRVELYGAKFATSKMSGDRNHSTSEMERMLPADLTQWRVHIGGRPKRNTDAYLLNCTGKSDCSIVSQQEITESGAMLVANNPQAGLWRIVVRAREQMTDKSIYTVREAQLKSIQASREEISTERKSGEKWTVALPDSARYAGFRVAGTPGVASEKEGLLIAITALVQDVP